MRTLSIKPETSGINLPAIALVEAGSPLRWLRMGWSDLRHDWPASLAVGAVFAAIGYLLQAYAWSRPHLALTLTSGFLLVSPFLAIWFYDLSRRREQPGTRRLQGARDNLASIGLFGLLLAFILSSWERISAILVALLYEGDPFVAGSLSLSQMLSPEHLGFALAYLLAGGVLAALVFAISVVSLPMMMDRKVDIATAIVTSLWVVRENPLPMLVWAALIAVLTLLAEAAWFVALAAVFPLLGHASWHAYRELVGRG